MAHTLKMMIRQILGIPEPTTITVGSERVGTGIGSSAHVWTSISKMGRSKDGSMVDIVALVPIKKMSMGFVPKTGISTSASRK
jgi:hypothetical protein